MLSNNAALQQRPLLTDKNYNGLNKEIGVLINFGPSGVQVKLRKIRLIRVQKEFYSFMSYFVCVRLPAP